MCAFIVSIDYGIFVLDLVFFSTKPTEGLEENLCCDLFCVEWDIKPHLVACNKYYEETVGCTLTY